MQIRLFATRTPMLLLGVLSILQIIFLPGYLLVRGLRLGGGIVATLVLSFALSLVANCLLVMGLVALGIYRPAIVYAVFALETALFLWRERRFLRIRVLDARRFRPGDFLGQRQGSPIERVLLAAAKIVIAGFALAGIAQVGQIFQQWDAVVSWNRWAIDWAANRLPSGTGLYPQLLPANVSLTYVFLQTSDVWIFAKAFQFLFCLMLLLAMLDAARATNHFGFVPGVLTTYAVLVAVLRFRMLGSGYADMPLAFFSFAAVYALLLANHAEGTHLRRRYLMVGAVLAAGAALTKQTGLYIALLYPLLAWRFVLQSGEQGPLRRHAPTLMQVALLTVALAAPWYLHKLADFHAATDADNTPLLLNDFHEGRSLPQRVLHAADMFADATSPLGAAILLLAIGLSLGDPLPRWLLGLVVLPVGLIWAAGFSYDLRNLALILPFLGMAAGMGLWRLCATRHQSASALHQPTGAAPGRLHAGGFPRWLRVGHVAGTLTLVVVAVCCCVSDKTLQECQERQQRLVGIPKLNQQLYAYFESHRGPAVIATDYLAAVWLPELGRRSVPCTCVDLNAFRAAYDRPEVHYALVRQKGAVTPVLDYLDGPAGRLVFEACDYCLYEKPRDVRFEANSSPVLESRR